MKCCTVVAGDIKVWLMSVISNQVEWNLWVPA